MYYLYAVNKKKLVCHDKAEYETYGLVCIGIKNGFSYVLAEINDVSTDFEYVKKLFSIETAGILDMDSELELYFSGLGKVKFEFTGASDIIKIGKVIGYHTL